MKIWWKFDEKIDENWWKYTTITKSSSEKKRKLKSIDWFKRFICQYDTNGHLTYYKRLERR